MVTVMGQKTREVATSCLGLGFIKKNWTTRENTKKLLKNTVCKLCISRTSSFSPIEGGRFNCWYLFVVRNRQSCAACANDTREPQQIEGSR